MGRVAIVTGGGIGGLAATIGLLRSGWQVTVFERAPEFRPVGAGLTLAPNAVRALDWLGLGDRLRAAGTAQGGAGLRTSSGRWLMRAHLAEFEARFGVPGFALHRSDVHQMLLEATAGAKLARGHEVTSVRSRPDAAAVTYESPSGPVTATADLVVVADGLHSRLRTDLFPDHPGPRYAGYVTWRNVVPAEADVRVETGLTESWGRGKRFGVVPLPDGRVYWFAGVSLPEGARRDAELADLARQFDGWHAPIPELLGASPPETLLRHDIYSVETPLPRYVTGRVVLLGDAAHAVTPDLGQGACQALEDAVTLAGLTADAPDLDAALADYDRIRRPRTQRLVRVSALAGRVGQCHNPFLAAGRNVLARVIPTRVLPSRDQRYVVLAAL
ncbi:FAD-dependent oxidoreductase [Kibdelosporangium aridum]|uniref:FAD-dependent oxidoreductase n=1 Tax=Kibdelosporangium aridum TaxID=2030 RepID=A0A428ZHP0_KIBAR|nr:FAD-dependent monooxygenase [Kibdelosporangium aridum]RSM87478.1 FAD-dependent oxidoreductase [Kibdelosporangium aridum]